MFDGSPVQRRITFGSLGLAGVLLTGGVAFSPVAANAVANLPPSITSKLTFPDFERIVPDGLNQEWVDSQEGEEETLGFAHQWHQVAVDQGQPWGLRMSSLNGVGNEQGPQILEGRLHGIDMLAFRWDGEVVFRPLDEVTDEQLAAFIAVIERKGAFLSQGVMFAPDPNEDLK